MLFVVVVLQFMFIVCVVLLRGPLCIWCAIELKKNIIFYIEPVKLTLRVTLSGKCGMQEKKLSNGNEKKLCGIRKRNYIATNKGVGGGSRILHAKIMMNMAFIVMFLLT